MNIESNLSDRLLDKVREARADLFGHRYAQLEDLDARGLNAFSHLLSRGHKGRVLSVSASSTVDFIVSGGVDHTMRIWEYDGSKMIYKFELEGQRWAGVVVKEADEEPTAGVDSNEKHDMTHQLMIFPITEDGEIRHERGRRLWVRFDESTLSDEEGNTGVPFTTDVTLAASDSYKLRAVLVHDVELEENQPEIDRAREAGNVGPVQSLGVTAVACAGMEGPFISGTSNGSLQLMCLPRAKEGGTSPLEVRSIRNLGIGGVSDIDIAELSESVDCMWQGPWLVAVAGQSGLVRVIRLSTDMRCMEFCQPLRNEDPVLKVRQVRDSGPLGVRFATCAGGGVSLWNIDGVFLTRLCLSEEISEMADLTVTNRDSGTLLLAGKDGTIGVWVIDPRNDAPPSDPLAVYTYKGRGIDVDQGSDLVEYAVHIRDGTVIVTWELLAARPECLISPESLSKWWELLIRPGKEVFVAEMVHTSPVTDFKVVEDDVEGPVLLSASTDGTVYTWSMMKKNRGEICAQLRSLRLSEIALPPGLLLISVFQFCSFAFGPSTGWRRSVKETVRIGGNIIFFGTNLSLELDIRNSDKFWWQLWVATHLMVVFLLCEVAGVQGALSMAQGSVQSSQMFKDAELQGRWSSMHLLRRLLGLLQALVSLMTWFCCTVGVAPLFKICAQATRCSRDEDNGKFYLDVTGGRSVECIMFLDVPLALRWEGYTSFAFSPCLILLLAMVYLAGLAPYAVVGGDGSYVQRGEILEWRAWAFNAERKATALNLGIFHPNPRNVFTYQLKEMISKALLPLITWLVPQPLIQMTLSTSLMALLYVESMYYPAFNDGKYCAIVQGSRLFAFCTMLCGLITVVVGEKSAVPLVLLFLNFAIVGAHTVYRVSNEEASLRAISRRSTKEAVLATLT